MKSLKLSTQHNNEELRIEAVTLEKSPKNTKKISRNKKQNAKRITQPSRKIKTDKNFVIY